MLNASSSTVAEIDVFEGAAVPSTDAELGECGFDLGGSLSRVAGAPAQKPPEPARRRGWRETFDARSSKLLTWLVKLSARSTVDRLGAVYDSKGTRTDLDVAVSSLIQEFAALDRSNGSTAELMARLERFHALCTKEAVAWTAGE